MSSIYYPTADCNPGGIPLYTCNPCPDYEYGRIRSVAFVKNTYTFVNPESAVEWSTAIQNGDAIVIWETQGNYDGGTTSELPGFGDRELTNGGTSHIAVYKDPNYDVNCDFYNAIRNSSDYSFVYRTSSKIHFANAPATITPKNPVGDDLKSNVVWEVTVKWQNPDSPCPYDAPDGIFEECYVVGN
jgi:hypothetical protein